MENLGMVNLAYPSHERRIALDWHRATAPRWISIELCSDAGPWYPEEEGAHPTIEYAGPRGVRGWYDVLPDGSPAYRVEGNRLELALTERMTTEIGTVLVNVVFLGDLHARLTQPLLNIRVMEV